MIIESGTRIGPYEIVGWIGAGGMGQVYRARDPRLGREVAIKLISQASAADADRVCRFEQEARAAGQLNHPNVLAVFDTGAHQGAPYIVSELLEGESLRSRLQSGPLPPHEAVEIARQAAHALAAAHDRGIVHRDVKPDNLFITRDGRLKVLDFGIAKLTVPGRATTGVAQTETSPDLILGTASYMSPEQVRGEAVDTRSDIFSVGVVLHEMLTGQPAFTRETVADTLSAILKETPRGHLPETIHPGLQRIVARCLEKTRESRYQSALDLGFALAGALDDGLAGATGATRPARRWNSALVAAAVTLGALVLGVVWLTRGAPQELGANPLANARFSRFTDWPGTEAGAEISPDGRFVLFIADRDGQFDLFLSQVDSGHFLNLTADFPPLRVPGSILKVFGFSGDGTEVWFAREGGMTRMPLTGGTRRPFLDEGAAAPAWSPDDKHVAYFDAGRNDSLFLADRTGADARSLVVDVKDFFARTSHTHNPVWSPDGGWIYFSHGPDPTEEMNVWRVPPSGGVPEQLTALRAAANFLAPIGPHALLYVARKEDRTGPWLWSLDTETRVAQRVTSGLEHYSSVSASRDGRRVVATVANPTSTLWQVPLTDRPADDRDVQPYPVARVRAFAPRLRVGSLFFLSGSGAGDSLWLSRGGQETEVWKASGDSLTEPPAVSPDGTRIAIVVRQAGQPRLSVMRADGTTVRTLAPSIEVRSAGGQGSADWSPDGKWIVVAGTDAQGPGLFRVPAEGGDPARIATGPLVNPVWSPDGSMIVYGGPVVSGQVPLMAVSPEGTPLALPGWSAANPPLARIGGGHRFLPGGNGLVYLPRPQSLDFWLMDFDSGTTRQITHLGDHGTLKDFDVTPDGSHIVFDRSSQNSDIYLIELPEP